MKFLGDEKQRMRVIKRIELKVSALMSGAERTVRQRADTQVQMKLE